MTQLHTNSLPSFTPGETALAVTLELSDRSRNGSLLIEDTDKPLIDNTDKQHHLVGTAHSDTHTNATGSVYRWLEAAHTD